MHEIKICFGCNKLKLAQDFEQEDIFWDNSDSSNVDEIRKYKQNGVSTELTNLHEFSSSCKTKVNICKICYIKLSNGSGIDNPMEDKQPELIIEHYQ
jgi:hypothetical protein